MASKRKPGKWGIGHPECCVDCETVDRPPAAHGRCANCYMKWYRRTPEGRKKVLEANRKYEVKRRARVKAKLELLEKLEAELADV